MPVKVKSDTQTKHQVIRSLRNEVTVPLPHWLLLFNQIWPAD